MTKDEKPGLETAYALETPDDSRRLYRDWAATYEDAFAERMDYVYPRRVAELFAERADARGPAIDLGAGTGLVGRALAELGVAEVDGLDISPEMLAVAEAKGGYRRLIEADMTARLPIDDGAYRGAVSAGTFTHGHVGPAALVEAFRVVAPGGVVVLGVNAAHFEAEGFAAAFDRLAASGAITPVELIEIGIYGERADHDHRDETALVAAAIRR